METMKEICTRYHNLIKSSGFQNGRLLDHLIPVKLTGIL